MLEAECGQRLSQNLWGCRLGGPTFVESTFRNPSSHHEKPRKRSPRSAGGEEGNCSATHPEHLSNNTVRMALQGVVSPGAGHCPHQPCRLTQGGKEKEKHVQGAQPTKGWNGITRSDCFFPQPHTWTSTGKAEALREPLRTTGQTEHEDMRGIWSPQDLVTAEIRHSPKRARSAWHLKLKACLPPFLLSDTRLPFKETTRQA